MQNLVTAVGFAPHLWAMNPLCDFHTAAVMLEAYRLSQGFGFPFTLVVTFVTKKLITMNIHP